jgi:hypothetical protein
MINFSSKSARKHYLPIPNSNDTWINRLKSQGVILLSDVKFEHLPKYIKLLGNSFYETEIKVVENSKKKFNSLQFLDLHSDDPNAKYVLLYCIEQGDEGGLSLLLDLGLFFSSNENSELYKNIKMKVPNFTFKEKLEINDYEFILSDRGYYFYPWDKTEAYEEPEKIAIEQLKNFIDKSPKLEIMLKKHDLLIFDNKKYIHGRTKIVEQIKKRKLFRVWIK